MKIYKVILEHESPSTPNMMERVEEYFTSDIIGSVFNVALQRASAMDADIIGIIEVAPSVTKL